MSSNGRKRVFLPSFAPFCHRQCWIAKIQMPEVKPSPSSQRDRVKDNGNHISSLMSDACAALRSQYNQQHFHHWLLQTWNSPVPRSSGSSLLTYQVQSNNVLSSIEALEQGGSRHPQHSFLKSCDFTNSWTSQLREPSLSTGKGKFSNT